MRISWFFIYKIITVVSSQRRLRVNVLEGEGSKYKLLRFRTIVFVSTMEWVSNSFQCFVYIIYWWLRSWSLFLSTFQRLSENLDINLITRRGQTNKCCLLLLKLVCYVVYEARWAAVWRLAQLIRTDIPVKASKIKQCTYSANIV